MSEDKKNKKTLDDEVEESVRKKSKKSKKEKEDPEAVEQLDESLDEEKKKKHKKDKKKKKDKDREDSEKVEEKTDKKSQSPVEELKEIETHVHTANNWEEADLGNDQRKLKFLKLMGAFKHKDDKQVAHKHARAATETQKIAQDLEKQFNEGLSHKFQAKQHMGLGFHTNVEPKKKPEKIIPESKHITFDDDDDN